MGTTPPTFRVWVSRSQGAAREAHCREWGAAPKTRSHHTRPPRPGQRAAHPRCLVPLWLPWLSRTRLASHSPPSRVRLCCLGFPHQIGTAATVGSRHSGPSQSVMKRCPGLGCAVEENSGQGEPGQVGSRGVRARACVSKPQKKMHVLGHRGGRRTEGAGCNVENAHREGAQNRRFAKCQGQTRRGGGKRLAEDQEQREEPTSPSKGRSVNAPPEQELIGDQTWYKR